MDLVDDYIVEFEHMYGITWVSKWRFQGISYRDGFAEGVSLGWDDGSELGCVEGCDEG